MNDQELLREIKYMRENLQRIETNILQRISKPHESIERPVPSDVKSTKVFNTLEFDVRPAAGFMGSPKAWREEMKPQIDYLTQTLKNHLLGELLDDLKEGKLNINPEYEYFVTGNPLDIQLLTNIDWLDNERTIGQYFGAHTYYVTANALEFEQGLLYIVVRNTVDNTIAGVCTVNVLNNTPMGLF